MIRAFFLKKERAIKLHSRRPIKKHHSSLAQKKESITPLMQGGEAGKNKILSFMRDPAYVPMKEKELVLMMQVKDDRRELFKRCLNDLLSEGRITKTKRGRYQIEDSLIVGTFISNRAGFGFVEAEGLENDLYIAAENTADAFLLDTVEAKVLPASRSGRREGKIVRVLLRGMSRLVGTYDEHQHFGFVIPDNPKIPCDIFVEKKEGKAAGLHAEAGEKVVVEITDYGDPQGNRNPEGRLIEILGNKDAPGVDVLSIIREKKIPEEFPDQVLRQADKIPEALLAADYETRADFRKMLLVTIDSEDAKDLDDAVSLEKDEDGFYHLGVHIADVTNYVQENSALDKEALERGTSVYLPDRVIPMLPRKLSNGICSLNEKQDRLALSCLMTIDPEGRVTDHRIVQSVICTNRRMTYTSVSKILDDRDPEECEKYRHLVPMFFCMKELSDLLQKKRRERGSIDFDLPESRITLDEKGMPLSIEPYPRNSATNLIEEFMLLANETVAEHYFWLDTPFVYRIHEAPAEEKMEKLGSFLQKLGIYLKSGRHAEVHPKEIQKALAHAREEEYRNLAPIMERIALRSMMQAKYSTTCSGHFGLAAPYYCHFTSPIRRYPDLQIHRIIKEDLRGKLTEGRKEHYESILSRVATHSSEMERRAKEAERQAEKRKKALYMQQRIGEKFDGVISGVTSFGFYVELPNTCEGLVHVSSLMNDYFEYDSNTETLTGRDFGMIYRMGQEVRIRVIDAEPDTGNVDFVLEE